LELFVGLAGDAVLVVAAGFFAGFGAAFGIGFGAAFGFVFLDHAH
jgi:hypothetical protein